MVNKQMKQNYNWDKVQYVKKISSQTPNKKCIYFILESLLSEPLE